MYNTHRGGKSGGFKGGKPFGRGGGGSWKKPSFGPRDAARPMLFDATCSQCGNRCQVPFRPNGSKPVLCRDCFRKDGDHAGPSRFSGAGAARPPFREDRPAAPAGDASARLEKQIRDMNEKLDIIIDLLED
jgi:CxxC-x17-CxxC domain-containing protein